MEYDPVANFLYLAVFAGLVLALACCGASLAVFCVGVVAGLVALFMVVTVPPPYLDDE